MSIQFNGLRNDKKRRCRFVIDQKYCFWPFFAGTAWSSPGGGLKCATIILMARNFLYDYVAVPVFHCQGVNEPFIAIAASIKDIRKERFYLGACPDHARRRNCRGTLAKVVADLTAKCQNGQFMLACEQVGADRVGGKMRIVDKVVMGESSSFFFSDQDAPQDCADGRHDERHDSSGMRFAPQSRAQVEFEQFLMVQG
ncbi:hypothetical protein [Desulfomicrobium apsheronum]|uniref:hypothetical protein n=1 Tax=Desulfomicrobium apsheronum TaxID=52560 RepID=UPI0015A69973|nr:hypothetical protein [Desulfomicrobium apsheronum]